MFTVNLNIQLELFSQDVHVLTVDLEHTIQIVIYSNNIVKFSGINFPEFFILGGCVQPLCVHQNFLEFK